MKKILFLIIFGAFLTLGEIHAGGRDGQAVGISHWGYVDSVFRQSVNKGHDLPSDACIGQNNQPGCLGWSGHSKNQVNRGTFDDEMAILMLVAQQITPNGAEFCAVQLQGGSKKGARTSWTSYFTPAGTGPDCTWLCKKGYYGQGCDKSGIADTCDSTTIKREDYKDYKITTVHTTDIRENIIMFGWDYPSSYRHHDAIMTITGWAPSGHGAFAQLVTFYSDYDGGKDSSKVSAAILRRINNERYLLCKDGFKPNAANTDCEIAVDVNLCYPDTASALNNLCHDYPKEPFTEATHSIFADGGCFKYKCKLDGQGFAGASDRKCVECGKAPKNGAKEGICIACKTGEKFDATTETGCTGTAEYRNNDLRYGKGKSADADLADQCWTIEDLEKYKKCIAGE